MLKFLIAIPVLALVLCLTNPSSDRHHEAVMESMSKSLPEGTIGEIFKRTRLAEWKYDNYWLFSMSHLGDQQASLGFLGFVFTND